MSALKEYKCPCCGGAIAFNTQVQKLKCPFCDTEFEMTVLDQFDEELASDGKDQMEWDSSGTPEWQEGEEEGMRIYSCKSCGGQIVGDENMAARSCPYCDSPIVVLGQIAGDLKPEYVIPFKLDKNAAKAKYYEHLSGKRLLPAVFKSQNHINEMKGIYVPYWLFDSKADARIRYKATKAKKWSDNEYDYTETSYYSVVRAGNLSFAHVPVDGSSKLDNTLLESVEPFDFKDAVSFEKAYFAGYFADRYDVKAEDCIERANKRINNSTESEFRKTVKGFDTVNKEGGSIQLNGGKASYAMYPVWILNTTWRGEKYIFAMNGQTGKFVGDLPVDKSASTRWLLGMTAAFSAAAFAIMSLMWFL